MQFRTWMTRGGWTLSAVMRASGSALGTIRKARDGRPLREEAAKKLSKLTEGAVSVSELTAPSEYAEQEPSEAA